MGLRKFQTSAVTVGYSYCKFFPTLMIRMEDVLDETVAEEDLKKFERRYHDSLAQGTVTHTVQFEYAWCLIRSKFPTDVKRGIFLLEDLSKSGNESGRRDCIYYLAIGNAKIKEYSKALGYTKVL